MQKLSTPADVAKFLGRVNDAKADHDYDPVHFALLAAVAQKVEDPTVPIDILYASDASTREHLGLSAAEDLIYVAATEDPELRSAIPVLDVSTHVLGVLLRGGLIEATSDRTREQRMRIAPTEDWFGILNEEFELSPDDVLADWLSDAFYDRMVESGALSDEDDEE